MIAYAGEAWNLSHIFLISPSHPAVEAVSFQITPFVVF